MLYVYSSLRYERVKIIGKSNNEMKFLFYLLSQQLKTQTHSCTRVRMKTLILIDDDVQSNNV